MRWPLVLLTMMTLIAGSAAAAPGDHWTITGDNVNLRRGPGTGHEVKRQLSRNQRVIEHRREGEWHRVEVVGADGLLGWVHHSLLETYEDVGHGAAQIEPEADTPNPLPKAPVEMRRAIMQKEVPPPEPAADLAPPETVLDEMRSYIERRDKLPKDPAEPRKYHSGREIISPVPIRNPGDQSRVPTELVLASSPKVAGIDVEAMEHFRDSVSYLNSRAWSVAGIKLFSEIEPVGGGVVQVKTTNDWFDVPTIGQTSYLNTLVDRWSSAKADGTPSGVMLVDPKGELLMHQTKP